MQGAQGRGRRASQDALLRCAGRVRRGRGGALSSELRSVYGARDAACPISTGRGTRRVRLVRVEGRGVST